MVKVKGTLILSVLTLLLLLTGCGTNPAETMYGHLEKAVVMEEIFEQQQEPLVEAEIQEHELYEEIIMLGMTDIDKIVSLSQEAISLVDKRQQLIDKEKMSIESSYEEFMKVEEFISKLDEGSPQELAIELQASMTNRFESYQSLYNQYSEALSLDRELYEMLQSEELTIDDLQEQIDKINESYQGVSNLKEEFNENTELYNQTKKEFYETTGIEVQYN
ncbi:YkyA family protein [Bacillus sp. FJAT-45350]|uniref:YkyA family protein n=1 Tax=Bacillus sp. FJAT-45350 TaxID=2011014 RepID=UPI000BB97BF3|nr:YkyA family protein [Bacillus sp. FJAT-45350]